MKCPRAQFWLKPQESKDIQFLWKCWVFYFLRCISSGFNQQDHPSCQSENRSYEWTSPVCHQGGFIGCSKKIEPYPDSPTCGTIFRSGKVIEKQKLGWLQECFQVNELPLESSSINHSQIELVWLSCKSTTTVTALRESGKCKETL